jgi:hypothetical protein
MRDRRSSSILLLAALLACRAETYGADDRPDFFDHPPDVHPARQWTGGTVLLSSPAFAGIDLAELSLRVGDHEVVADRIDSATVRITLPAALASGVYVLVSGAEAGTSIRLAEVEVVGWRGTRSASERGCSTPVPFPEALPTGVLLSNCHTLGGPVFISARTNAGWSYDSLRGGTYSPSTSYRAGSIVDRDRRVLRLLPGGAWSQVDTAPCCYNRQLFELSDGLWLRTTNHYADFYRDGVGAFGGFNMESPWLLVRSHASGRATFIPDHVPTALPIINTETGGIVATVGNGVTRARAAVFAADDAVLYLVGETSWGFDPRLLVVDPRDGSIIDADTARPGGFALATHPMTAGWLYELDREGPWWVLRVRDAETLEIIAAPMAPNPDDACSGQSYPTLIVDPGQGTAHAFLPECFGGHRWIDFDLLTP